MLLALIIALLDIFKSVSAVWLPKLSPPPPTAAAKDEEVKVPLPNLKDPPVISISAVVNLLPANVALF